MHMHVRDFTVAQRVNAERLALLGWTRAILLQLAHPLVAAGVAEHSSFRGGAHSAVSRLRSTVGAMLAITFGDDGEREQAIEGIRAIHRRVHGALRARCGPFEAGTAYSAEDPELLLWVHATLVDSILRVHDLLVEPLSEEERNACCAESAGVAVTLGARAADVPMTWAALQRYMDSMSASGALVVGDDARDLARAVLSPPFAAVVAPLTALNIVITAGLLPGNIREQYGLAWSARRARLFGAAVQIARVTRRVSPAWIALWPEARKG